MMGPMGGMWLVTVLDIAHEDTGGKHRNLSKTQKEEESPKPSSQMTCQCRWLHNFLNFNISILQKKIIGFAPNILIEIYSTISVFQWLQNCWFSI